MSKMVMPEMNVVRFQESDVIVASSNVLYLSGFNDTTHYNGVMTFNGITAQYNNESGNTLGELGTAINNAGFGNHIQAKTTDNMDNILEHLIEFDWSENSEFKVTAEDGGYTWNGSMWMHQ